MSAIMHPRIAPYQALAQSHYTRLSGKRTPVQVKVTPSSIYAGAIARTNTLYLHPLTFLGPEDLPFYLRVKGPGDPRLRTKQYFEKLTDFLSRTFQIAPERFTNLPTIFDLHLRTWAQPHLIHRIKNFALAHEVGHIHLGHTPRPWERPLAYVASVVVATAALHFLPLIPALLCSLLAIDVLYRLALALREYSEQYQEKEADFAAMQITKDFQAAQSFFTAIDDHYNYLWDQKSSSTQWYDRIVHPETLFHISHPSPKTRIDYLRSA